MMLYNFHYMRLWLYYWPSYVFWVQELLLGPVLSLSKTSVCSRNKIKRIWRKTKKVGLPGISRDGVTRFTKGLLGVRCWRLFKIGSSLDRWPSQVSSFKESPDLWKTSGAPATSWSWQVWRMDRGWSWVLGASAERRWRTMWPSPCKSCLAAARKEWCWIKGQVV